MQAMQTVRAAGGRLALHDQQPMLHERNEPDLLGGPGQQRYNNLLRWDRRHVHEQRELLPALLLCRRLLPPVVTVRRASAFERDLGREPPTSSPRSCRGADVGNPKIGSAGGAKDSLIAPLGRLLGSNVRLSRNQTCAPSRAPDSGRVMRQ